MSWVIGIFGFFMGFASGQYFLLRWLKDKSQSELLNNKNLRYTYGLFNWGMAIMGCISALWIYHHYFQ